MRIDVNVDIGEGFAYDDELIKLATSANVCCGAHAGSRELTLETIEKCKRAGVRIGMHPGFPDRASMGRSLPRPDEADRWFESLLDQADSFMKAYKAAYFKPHGAWYNLLCSPSRIPNELNGMASGMLFGFCRRYVISPMLADCAPYEHLKLYGCPPIREGFADRAYDKRGFLVPRGQPEAMLEDPETIAKQVTKLALQCQSICVHGDSEGCTAILELVVKTLEDGGYEVGS